MPRLTSDQYAVIDRDIQDGLTPSRISRRNGAHVSTVYRCIIRRRDRGTVKPQKARGRPRVMDVAALSRAVQLLLSNEEGGARFVVRQLFREKLIPRVIAHTTLLRNLREAAKSEGIQLAYSTAAPPKVLTRKNRAQRLAFARAHLHDRWGRYLFTDRKRYYLRFPGARVTKGAWYDRAKGRRPGAWQPTKPACANVYGGIACNGTTALHFVAGTTNQRSEFRTLRGQPARNITKKEYRKVLRETLLPGGRRLSSARGEGEWWLQQDGDPCHRAAGEIVNEWNMRLSRGCVHLMPDWPPNSPDLSPIENVWGLVQARVNLAGCTTVASFKREVNKQFRDLSQQYLGTLFNSMPRRLQQVIDRDGDRTDY